MGYNKNMELYFHFLSTLAFGLVGVGLVMKILLENLFNEWDAFNDLARRANTAFAGKRHVELIRAEDILMEAERKNMPETGTRRMDQRREQLKELNDIESRLKSPAQMVFN